VTVTVTEAGTVTAKDFLNIPAPLRGHLDVHGSVDHLPDFGQARESGDAGGEPVGSGVRAKSVYNPYDKRKDALGIICISALQNMPSKQA
jgi:hypothetical protein